MSSSRVRIVTYNLLSSSLAPPDRFPGCHPAHLHSSTRLTRIFKRLEDEAKHASIICLQEVSQSWYGKLMSFFQQHEYQFIGSLYGHRGNGYMGIGIAFPNSVYRLEECEVTRVSDSKRWVVDAKSKSPSDSWMGKIKQAAHSVWSRIQNSFSRLFSSSLSIPVPEEDPWKVSMFRSNTICLARLSRLDDGTSFCVATYHMPCVFQIPQVMIIHAALSSQIVQKFAGEDPVFFAGDFNFTPSSLCYELLTRGTLQGEEVTQNFVWPPEFVPPSSEDTWTPDLQSTFRSAYAEALGSEPSCTNIGTCINPWFVDTLDYIFFSGNIQVDDVNPLLSKDEVLKDPLPNESEPSDHMCLGADFRILRADAPSSSS